MEAFQNLISSDKHESPSDIISIFIYSLDEAKNIGFLLVKNEEMLFLPRKRLVADLLSFVAHSPRYKQSAHSLQESTMEFVSRLTGLKDIKFDIRLCYIFRTFVPSKHTHLSHSIYAICLPKEKFLQINSSLEAFTVESLHDVKQKLERKFILSFAEHFQKMFKYNAECSIPGGIIDEVLPHQLKPAHLPEYHALVLASGYTAADTEVLFESFVLLSYPYSKVSFKSMKNLLGKLGWTGKEERVFRTIDSTDDWELDLKHFMCGMLAMDPLTKHGGAAAELRCKFIFTFYDLDGDEHLDEKEIQAMIYDINVLQGHLLNPDQLKAAVQKAFKTFEVSPSNKVPLNTFLNCVGSLKFRGTSTLFRASSTIALMLAKQRTNNPRDSLIGVGVLKPSECLPLNSEVNLNKRPKEADDSCCLNKTEPSGAHDKSSEERFAPGASYSLAEHTVMVKKSGTITNISHLLDMERAGEVLNTGLDVREVENFMDFGAPHDVTSRSYQVLKQFSAQAFNTRSLPNEMMCSLKYFECEAYNKKAFDWGPVEMPRLAKHISATCMALIDILEEEPRLLRISAPCYVLGDLHGNFHDLIYFEKTLWRLGPHLTPANFLFLGDYVDRGNYGVEVVLYLFAQKLLSPSTFHLLRGNHEVRAIQKSFSFYSECINKFGEVSGNTVWEDINKVFDRMPLAAIIDNKIFCIHGGIPLMEGSLDLLDTIPCPLPNPESESIIAWQMLWNDPIAPDDMNKEVRKQLDTNKGFAYNYKRQTAYVFDEKAFNNFLERHGISHIIRAHEVKEAGFEIQQSGRLMTVFSSSQYCGGTNEAACILIHDQRLRIIRIDTT